MSAPDTAMKLVRAAAQAAGLGQRTDSQLLADFLDKQDSAAFEALVRRHGPLVLSACRQVLRDDAAAEDAFQATFVTLYQKAATIRDQRSVAGWLFRVARRSATSIRRGTLRRARREAAKAIRPSAALQPDLSWQDAVEVLHEELDRLPEMYRAPIILCYLQGLARDESARRLGWSIDTFRGRLERGRNRLKARLQKRGITLSAGLLAALSTGALPARLVAATVSAARASSPLATSWSAIPLKGVAGLALAAAVVIAVAVQHRGLHAQPTSDSPKSSAPAAKTEPETPKSIVTGRVLHPDGKPVAGAEVFVRPAEGKESARSTATTDAQGRFSLPVPNPPTNGMTIVATARNLAAGWETWDGDTAQELTLVLAKDDLPVEGRILDLEGKPVGGVNVRVMSASTIPDGGPRAILEWQARRRPRPMLNTIAGPPPGATAETKTDAAGKFKLIGIGRDRVVRILVTGPGIAHEQIEAFTVAELDPKPARAARIFPSRFDFLAAPARPIRGTVRDTDTGKPVSGVSINAFAGPTSVTTDRDGRYELPGYKKGPKYTVYAWPPDGSTYFPGMAEAADIAGFDALEIDIKLKRGIPVTGRLCDTKSGQPIAGLVRYYALAGNPNVTAVSVGEKVGEFFSLTVKTKADGSFTCAVLPGLGVLAVTVEGNRYPAARVDPKGFVEAGSPGNDTEQLRISVGGAGMGSLSQDSYQAIVFLNVDAKKPLVEQTIDLTPTEPVRVRLLDADGKPLTGVRVRGLNESGSNWSNPMRGAEFTARPPHPDRPRRLAFRHDERKLVGTTMVTTGTAKPIEIRLEPSGTVTGRLLDNDGRPISKTSIFAWGSNGRDNKTVDTVRVGAVFTDADGRFRIDGMLPGVVYELYFRESKPMGRGGTIAREVTLKPGEERDLGDLKAP